jgi:hypothetical protein
MRRNYTLRILGAALIAGILFCMVTEVSNWAKAALTDLTIVVTAAAVGLIGEEVMRLFPATMEPAMQGGSSAS